MTPNTPVTLSSELFWLTATALFTSVLWLPYVTARMLEIGLWPTLQGPKPAERLKAGWAHRLTLSHANAVENLVVFAALVLAAEVSHRTSSLTALAAAAYFFGRVFHVLSYTINVPIARTAGFAVGWIACFVIGFSILGMV